MVAIWNRGVMRAVRLVAYNSVLDYIRRSMDAHAYAAALGHAVP